MIELIKTYPEYFAWMGVCFAAVAVMILFRIFEMI